MYRSLDVMIPILYVEYLSANILMLKKTIIFALSLSSIQKQSVLCLTSLNFALKKFMTIPMSLKISGSLL